MPVYVDFVTFYILIYLSRLSIKTRMKFSILLISISEERKAQPSNHLISLSVCVRLTGRRQKSIVSLTGVQDA